VHFVNLGISEQQSTEVFHLNDSRRVPLSSFGLFEDDSQFAVLGVCDLILSTKISGSDHRQSFAIFEGFPFNLDEVSFFLDEKWLLQTMNSFIGSDATVGVAITSNALFFMWREEVISKDEESSDISTTQSCIPTINKRFKYFTTSSNDFEMDRMNGIPDDLDIETQNSYQQLIDRNIQEYLEIFLNIARICSSKRPRGTKS
jgi:hypothetical protein